MIWYMVDNEFNQTDFWDERMTMRQMNFTILTYTK